MELLAKAILGSIALDCILIATWIRRLNRPRRQGTRKTAAQKWSGI